MEKIKSIFTAFLLIANISFSYSQQEEENIPRSGLISAKLTFAPSYMFASKQSYFYLHGNLEAFLDSRLSVAGDIYYNLGNSTDHPDFEFNHGGFFGMNYHFIKKNNDLYLGFQPGLSISKLNAAENNIPNSKTGYNPLLSAVAGYNFYVNKFFHFFLQGRFITGEHTYNLHKNLTEIRFSAGLGFNINAKK